MEHGDARWLAALWSACIVLIDNPLAVAQCSVTDRPIVALLVFEGDAFCTLRICIVMLVIMLLVLHQSVMLINKFKRPPNGP